MKTTIEITDSLLDAAHELLTADRGFSRFPELNTRNPLPR